MEKRVVVFGVEHRFQHNGFEGNKAFGGRLLYLVDKFSASLVMEEWIVVDKDEEEEPSYTSTLASERLEYQNVGTPLTRHIARMYAIQLITLGTTAFSNRTKMRHR